MSEAAADAQLSEAVLRHRLEAFEANRQFFIQMWLQNPALAAQAGPRIRSFLEPARATGVEPPPAAETSA